MIEDRVVVGGLTWTPAKHPHTFPELWMADGLRASVWKLGPGAIPEGPWRWSAKEARTGATTGKGWHYGSAKSRDEAMELASAATRGA